MIRATVSGSFHRHMSAIVDAVSSLGALGVEVLSPADPRVVDADGDFLFVASDRLRSRRLVEDRHLEAIRASDFLWVVCPDGYTGASTSGEILAAAVLGKPILSTHAALDITIGDYVERVDNMADAVARAARIRASWMQVGLSNPHALLDPEALVKTADLFNDLRLHLNVSRGNGHLDAERRFTEVRRAAAANLGLPTVN